MGRFPNFAVLFVLATLAACGAGGGGDGSAAAPSPENLTAAALPPGNVAGFAYVANQGSDNVSAYTINATTGALTSVGAAVAAGIGPSSVSVDPSGKFAYVVNATKVRAYTIHAATGALTPIGAAVAAGTSPVSVTTTGTIQ